MQDDKYIVFKKDEFDGMVSQIIAEGADRCSIGGGTAGAISDQFLVDDAIVIRRQDRFAGPALHTYAASIGLVASILKINDKESAEQLLAVADYFHQQALLADAEGFKFPD